MAGKFDPTLRGQGQKTLVTQTSTVFQGPLPPPEALDKYNQILPGSADRIIQMAEAQARHRQENERLLLQQDHKLSVRGQIFGFILSFSAISFGFVLILNDKNVSGLTSLLSGLAVLVASYLFSRKSQ